MLTFFEYLRQRAYESVLAGAQEALDVLERQQSLDPPKKQLTSNVNEVGTESTNKPPRKRDEFDTSKQSARPTETIDKPLPSPRDQTIPKRESKGRK